MTLRRKFGEAYILYKIRSGRGSSFTGEVDGLLNAFQRGGVLILIINQYFHWLTPLWLLPVFWIIQKAIEYYLGYKDEKKWGWWKFENNYVTANTNPFMAKMMEHLKTIENQTKKAEDDIDITQ